MRYISRFLRNGLIGSLLLSVAGSATLAYGQGRMTIQATAKGTSTQLGRMIDVNIYIDRPGMGSRLSHPRLSRPVPTSWPFYQR
jgi:hypothetical protein